ncbi:MAG TPA: molybdopterin converting factor subunit 1 [Myxococcota bacterium]|jgi:molybdopterin synthase catalytic subunit
MAIRVLYFAACRERTGVAAEDLELGDLGSTVADVVAAVIARHPALGTVAAQCRVAVNQAFARASDPVPDGAELALIPPVAGG